jgi:hypothetical protein
MVQRIDLRGPNGRGPTQTPQTAPVDVDVTDMIRIHVGDTSITVSAADVVASVREFNRLYQEIERLRALSGGGD